MRTIVCPRQEMTLPERRAYALVERQRVGIYNRQLRMGGLTTAGTAGCLLAYGQIPGFGLLATSMLLLFGISELTRGLWTWHESRIRVRTFLNRYKNRPGGLTI